MTTTMQTTGTREIQFREAINECLRQEMERDENVIIMGEEIAGGAGRQDQGVEDAWGGPFRTTVGLIQQFGKDLMQFGRRIRGLHGLFESVAFAPFTAHARHEAEHVLDALSAMGTKEVTLGFQDDLSPARLVPSNDEDTLAVVMPMRV